MPVQNPKRRILWAVMVAALGVALLAAPSRAQDGATYAQGEITISCPAMGVGGVVRAGDWVGLKLGISDSASKSREIIVQVSIPDADGDRVEFERSMTTNPGTPQPLWMYVRLPSRFSAQSSLNVTAFEAVEGGAVREGERPPLNPGRVLGVAKLVRPMTTESRTEGLIGIVGNRTMGLRAYQGPEQSNFQAAFAGHERSRIVARLDADSLPDRWMGLSPFEFLVWSDVSPTTLGSERAAALREWVQRGGHLVVVLPAVAQVWTDEQNNVLSDIVPRVRVRRQEGVSLEPYRALIDVRLPDKLAMPEKEVLQTFTPLPGATEQEAIGIIAAAGEAGPDGAQEWVAVRRLVGTGMVTLVGLDLNSRWMDRQGAPDPELFWHRVLGRRGALALSRESGTSSAYIRSRDPVTVDGFIPGLIAKRGQAAAGVLLGFVVFIMYWLLAGPPGFAVLKKMGWGKHGWVAFVAAAGVFTAVAWGGATLIRPGRTEAKHLTILDHVYGQNTDHARSWFSLLVPEYGQMTLTLGEPVSRERTRYHNALAPWEPDDASGEGFTDARGYRVDCKNPDQATIPTRATVKQLQADWAGAPPWKMPRPVGADPAAPDGAVRLADEKADSYATGMLVHDLPGPLTDVVVIVNRGQKDLLKSLTGGPLWADAWSFSIGTWNPGAEGAIDLRQKTAKKPASGETLLPPAEYFKRIIEGSRSDVEGGDVVGAALTKRLEAISFFSQLEPPDIKARDMRSTTARAAQRKYTHTLDLGRWLSQPCVIVIGQIGAGADDAPSPVPLYAGNGASARPLSTSGRTLVRWIYPLGSRPPGYPKPGDTSPAAPEKEGGDPAPTGEN